MAIMAFPLMFWSESALSICNAATVQMETSDDDHPSPAQPVVSGRAVPAFAVYAFLSGAGIQATNVYLPLFSRVAVHLSPLAAGITVAVAGAVGLSARILWGRAKEVGARAGSLLAWLAIAASVGTVCLAIAGNTESPTLLWTGVIIHGCTAIGGNVIVMVGLIERVPPARSGAASATVAMAMYLGFALGPLLMGGLLAIAGSYALGWCAISACYLGGVIAARAVP